MLGSDLVKTLTMLPGLDVYRLSRSESSISQSNSIQVDLTDFKKTQKQIQDIKPDLIVHAAAWTQVDACESEQRNARLQNTEVVENLIEVSNQVNAAIIFFSTDYVFSGKKKGAYLENDPIEPVNYYGQTKAWAEEAFRKKSKRYMIFRITWLYGEKGNHFPKAILNQVAQNKEISVVNDQWGRPTWTKDVAEAIGGLLTSGKKLLDQYNGEIFHLANSGEINWSGYARRVLDRAGFAHIPVREISSAQLQRPAKRPENSVLCLDKTEKLLGIKMRSWELALDQFMKETGFKNG